MVRPSISGIRISLMTRSGGLILIMVSAFFSLSASSTLQPTYSKTSFALRRINVLSSTTSALMFFAVSKVTYAQRLPTGITETRPFADFFG
ncbi:MAG: hypothetical protein ACI8PG_005297 [Planctomycetota bacterium]|jgi:hypothetical protein